MKTDKSTQEAPVTNLPTFLTVKQFAQQQPALGAGGVRFDLHNRQINGLAQSGAVIMRGRRVLIDGARYIAWMENQSAEAGA